jgi:hypothetical protein
MKGDYTKYEFKIGNKYMGVLKQQGRVRVDSDWDESSKIEINTTSNRQDQTGIHPDAQLELNDWVQDLLKIVFSCIIDIKKEDLEQLLKNAVKKRLKPKEKDMFTITKAEVIKARKCLKSKLK